MHSSFTIYVLIGSGGRADGTSIATLYGRYVLSGRVFSGSGPMWFALALFLFGLLLTVMGLGASFLAAHLARRLPGLRRIL